MGIDRVLLEAMGVHARAAAATGQLAMSELAVSEEDCDVLSARTDGLLWHNLVARRAWSGERYAAWLGRLRIAALVNPADKPAVQRKHDAGRVSGLNRLARPVRPSSRQRAPSSASCHRACRCPVRGPRRTAGRRRGFDGHRSAIRRCRRPAPRLEGGVPLALSRSPAEDWGVRTLLGQGRRGREAPPPRVRLRAREPRLPRAVTPRKASVGGLRRGPSDADAEAHHHDM